MKTILFILILMGLMPSCGSESSLTDISGTYLFSGLTCDGSQVTTTGFRATTTLGNGQGSTTYTSTTNSCVVTASYSYVVSGSTLTAASTGVTCVPSNCTQTWVINGTSLPVQCPTAFGSGGSASLTINGSIVENEYTVGSVKCKEKYLKQ